MASRHFPLDLFNIDMFKIRIKIILDVMKLYNERDLLIFKNVSITLGKYKLCICALSVTAMVVRYGNMILTTTDCHIKMQK